MRLQGRTILVHNLVTGDDDLLTVLQELGALASCWNNIGLAVGLKNSTLESISQEHSNNSEKLKAVIVLWLKRSDNVDRLGPPTWRRIVEVVGADIGGKNNALANALAKKYHGEIVHNNIIHSINSVFKHFCV